MKAHKLQPGHVLVDPSGHLYEVMSLCPRGTTIHAWLWPDSSTLPDCFQTFEWDDDIVSVSSTPRHAASTEETVMIPMYKEGDDVAVSNGTAE